MNTATVDFFFILEDEKLLPRLVSNLCRCGAASEFEIKKTCRRAGKTGVCFSVHRLTHSHALYLWDRLKNENGTFVGIGSENIGFIDRLSELKQQQQAPAPAMN